MASKAAKKAKRRAASFQRKEGLQRTPSGQLSRSKERREKETADERQDQRSLLLRATDDRARALGLTRVQASDPISETIAGRMALRGLLTRRQYEAAEKYAALVAAAYREMCAPKRPGCTLNQRRSGEAIDDAERYARVMRRYNDAFGAVRDAGERANRAVNILIRDEFEPPISEREHLRRGLDALAVHFGLPEAEAA